MIDNAYKDSIAQQIVEKQIQIEILKRTSSSAPILQRILSKATIQRLELEVDVLIHLLNEEESLPTIEDVLALIDLALDQKDEEEFMKLTNLLKNMQKN